MADSNNNRSPLDLATEAAERVGRFGRNLLFSPLRLPGLLQREQQDLAAKPGEVAGIESFAGLDKPPEPGAVTITCREYDRERSESREIDDLDAFFQEERPEWARVRWVQVSGLNPYVVNRFRRQFDLHTLAAEDTLRTSQRPKFEQFDTYAFIVIRLISVDGEGRLDTQQVSMYFFKDLLITFQEKPETIWDPLRERTKKDGSRMRNEDTSYLLYAMLDAAVDHSFPILEHYGDVLEHMESRVVKSPEPRQLQHINAIKRQLIHLRRIVWPTREVIDNLYRDEMRFLSKTTKTFMRDVYDHTVQVMDIIDTHREMAGGLTDLYMSAVSNRMNEVMKVLTIMASFFIPITFIAGVYGMNFTHMPELDYKYAYPIFWIVVLLVSGGMFAYFWHKRWLGR